MYQSVPFLLHGNQSDSPGHVAGGENVRGIFGFERSGFARLYSRAKPGNDLKDLLVPRHVIQSLMLIGSTGSVGHTRESDLDYWVCLHREDLTDSEYKILLTKLEKVTLWAEKRHKTEVHFFPMDLEDLRDNRLGDLDEESSGQVMPLLLKEEFYRTSLQVAGRMPLWWTIPAGTSRVGYDKVAAAWKRFQSPVFNPGLFVDMGFPAQAGPREYLGAAMWQAHKSQKDPFKAVLKIILILEQVERGLQAPLLCDQVKEAVLTSNVDQLPIDPYLMTMRRVLDFAQERLSPEIQELVRISVLFKMHAPGQTSLSHMSDPKAKALSEMRREWRWSESRFKEISDYTDWPERRKQELGQKLKDLLFDLYMRIAAQLRTQYPEEVMVEDEGMIRLNAQILARYANHGAKVEDLPSALLRKNISKDFNIAREKGHWRVYETAGRMGDYFYSAARAARVAAWIVHNHIWSPQTVLRIRPGDTAMRSRNLMNLATLLGESFPPMSISEIEQGSLMAQPIGPKVLILNMEEATSQSRLMTAELVYRTSHGEMCHEILTVPEQGREEDKYLSLVQRVADLDQLHVYIPHGPAEEQINAAFKKALDQHGKTYTDQTGKGARGAGKARLDMTVFKPPEELIPSVKEPAPKEARPMRLDVTIFRFPGEIPGLDSATATAPPDSTHDRTADEPRRKKPKGPDPSTSTGLRLDRD